MAPEVALHKHYNEKADVFSKSLTHHTTPPLTHSYIEQAHDTSHHTTHLLTPTHIEKAHVFSKCHKLTPWSSTVTLLRSVFLSHT